MAARDRLGHHRLDFTQTTADECRRGPTGLPAYRPTGLRAYGHIENRLRRVRDVTSAEDLSQARTGHVPTVTAVTITLRNLAISLRRLAGASSIATACRTDARHLGRPLAMIT